MAHIIWGIQMANRLFSLTLAATHAARASLISAQITVTAASVIFLKQYWMLQTISLDQRSWPSVAGRFSLLRHSRCYSLPLQETCIMLQDMHFLLQQWKLLQQIFMKKHCCNKMKNCCNKIQKIFHCCNKIFFLKNFFGRQAMEYISYTYPIVYCIYNIQCKYIVYTIHCKYNIIYYSIVYPILIYIIKNRYGILYSIQYKFE